jgi:radical SAM protein with 4Fe4S-binding SPASM domain
MQTLAKLNYISLKKNIPISATIELTYKCCYNCRHCYLKEILNRDSDSELKTEEIKNILIELRKLNTITISFTGGEPLLRNDLNEIISEAYNLNFDINLFTNLYLADYSKLKELYKAGLRNLEVSFYGRKNVYEYITNLDGSFNRVKRNILLAKKIGFKLKIKTPILKIGIKELDWIYNFSKKYALDFAIDPILTPLNNGKSLDKKLIPNIKELKKVINKPYINTNQKNSEINGFSYISCGAGRNVISISPYGDIMPCLQMPVNLGNIRKNKIKKIWNDKKAKKIRKELAIMPEPCKNCEIISFCSRCPGISYVKGDILKVDKKSCLINKWQIKNK